MNRFVLAALAAIVFVLPASAHSYTLGALKIGHPWARATPKGETSTRLPGPRVAACHLKPPWQTQRSC